MQLYFVATDIHDFICKTANITGPIFLLGEKSHTLVDLCPPVETTTGADESTDTSGDHTWFDIGVGFY